MKKSICIIAPIADYELSQHHPALRRCRFIAHTADLSAPGAFPAIPMKTFICIIE
jgi:hypothetical protein